MYRNFKITTIEDRLILYKYVLNNYIIHSKVIKVPYKTDKINPYRLGICFYLKRTVNVVIEELPEMMEVYSTYAKTGSFIAPAGDIEKRIKFLKEVITLTKLKLT